MVSSRKQDKGSTRAKAPRDCAGTLPLTPRFVNAVISAAEAVMHCRSLATRLVACAGLVATIAVAIHAAASSAEQTVQGRGGGGAGRGGGGGPITIRAARLLDGRGGSI